MAEPLEPFPEVRLLGRDHIQRLCDEWCGGPQAKECGVEAVHISDDCLDVKPAIRVSPKHYDQGDVLHFPFDSLLGFIIKESFQESDQVGLMDRLRRLRQAVGTSIFQRYKVGDRALTMALNCPECSLLLLTNRRYFEGRQIELSGTEEGLCPRCGTMVSIRPDMVFLVTDPRFTREELGG